MTNDRATHAYVGICRQCNGTMMLIVDLPGHTSDVAQTVAECITAGFVVERMTIEAARARASQRCGCEKREAHT